MATTGRLISTLACLALLQACSNAPVRDYDHASDTETLSSAEQRRWHAADQLDQTLRHKGLVYEDPELRQYLQQIMDRLYPEFKGAIQVYAADSPALNAFALPNGSIYMNIGLIARMQNEAQLATVLGHEAAHFIGQHSLKQRESADAAILAGLSITLLTGIPFSGDLLTGGILSGYSQEFEREADRKGFERLAASGYDTTEAARVFELMLEEVEALDIDQPFLYSSHPRLEERIQTLNELAREQTQHAGEKGTQRFATKTKDLREVVLQRYLKQNDYKRLILILENEQQRARYPKHARFYLGEAYRLRNQTGDADKSLAAYQASIQEAPEYAANYRALGMLRMKAGDSQQAIEYLEKYLSLASPQDDTAYAKRYLKKLKEGK